MGYEIKLLIGKSCLRQDEAEKDMDNPFDDGSGFPYKKDAKGSLILTGRKQSYFMQMAMVDLCKLGYQDDPLNNLINEWHEKARALKDTQVLYIYDICDGNKELTEDRYGDPLISVPIKHCLKAVRKTHNPNDPYRRLTWALALLESMAQDPEPLEVVFFGY